MKIISTDMNQSFPTALDSLLTEEQIKFFKENGYVKVSNLFSKSTADQVKQRVIALAQEENSNDSSDLNALAGHKNFIDGFFRPSKFLTESPASDMNTTCVFQALDELLGEKNYLDDTFDMHGLFTMTLPGYAPKPWSKPIYSGSWHIDNGSRYEENYSLESARCACVPAFLVTDVLPEGGSTLCIPGSHKVMAALMKRLGHISYEQMRSICEVLASSAPRIDTLDGKAGDVVIMHAFMVHSPSANSEDTLRIMSNSAVGLKRGRNYDLHSDTLSPSEACIAEVVYGLEPKGLSLSKIALKMLTALRPVRKIFSGHPSWNNNVSYPKKLFLLIVVSVQAVLSKIALRQYTIEHFQDEALKNTKKSSQ